MYEVILRPAVDFLAFAFFVGLDCPFVVGVVFMFDDSDQ